MSDPSITALEEVARITRAAPLDTKFGRTCDALAVVVHNLVAQAAANERGESSYAPLPYRKMRPSEWSRRNKRTESHADASRAPGEYRLFHSCPKKQQPSPRT